MDEACLLNSLPSLAPLSFFDVEVDIPYLLEGRWQELGLKQAMPTTTCLLMQDTFAQIAAAWHEEGLAFFMQADAPLNNSAYPDIEKGDSLEIFIDTRNIKTTSYNTRFCHYFFFLPKAVEGVAAGEKTHLRSQESRPLCDPSLLNVEVKRRRAGYTMHIWIPQSCLYGYDPLQSASIGFNYRVNRHKGAHQDFSVSSSHYPHYTQMPSLWATMHLLPSNP